jgi:Spy/CpxP family protein refolding chaperone
MNSTKARFQNLISRVSLVSVVALSAATMTACARSTPSDGKAAVAAEAQAAPAASPEHRPGYQMFRRIEALDLRPAQRAALAEVEQNLAAELAPHRATMKSLANAMADSIESGTIDEEQSARQKEALLGVLADARAATTTAMNDVHDALDPDQRVALVAQLRAEHEARKAGKIDHDHSPIARLAVQLGLSEDQKQALHEAVQKGADELVPSRRERREAHEAKMRALGDAFVSDAFDAADFDLASGAEDAIALFTEASTRAVEVSNRVLSSGQRRMLAEMLRARAEKI